MYKSMILPAAQEDIRGAALWYNKRSKGLGKKFTVEVRKKVLFIRQNPLAANLRYDNMRTAVLNVFPFMIHYTIDESNNTVIISAILRNPGIWKNR